MITKPKEEIPMRKEEKVLMMMKEKSLMKKKKEEEITQTTVEIKELKSHQREIQERSHLEIQETDIKKIAEMYHSEVTVKRQLQEEIAKMFRL